MVERAIQLYRISSHRDPVFQQIEHEVMKLRTRGINQREDVCLWKMENGEFKPGFITSQTWNLPRVHSPKVVWFKGIWFPEATMKFTFWIANHHRLATGDRILKWNSQAISTCWLGNSTTETRDHLFFEYSYSKEVWKGTIKDLVGGCTYQWSQVVQVLANGFQEGILTFLMHNCFQAVAQPASCLIARLDKLIRNRITSLRRKAGGKHEKTMQIWFGRR